MKNVLRALTPPAFWRLASRESRGESLAVRQALRGKRHPVVREDGEDRTGIGRGVVKRHPRRQVLHGSILRLRAFLPYSVGSYFRTPVAAGAVDAGLTASFRSFMASHPDQKGTPYPVLRGAGGNAWGTAYAEAGASDPVWRLTGAVPADVADLKTTGFRAPEWLGQVLTGTSDSPFV